MSRGSTNLLNTFKYNLKELTTKSALSAWGQWSLSFTCPVAGYIDHVIHWRVQFSFVLGSVNLSNNSGDGNEKGKNAEFYGFYKQNNNFAHA